MGVTDKINNFSTSLENGIKTSMKNIINIALRILTGLFIGLTISLIFQELIHFGNISLFFIILVCFGLFYKLTNTWSTVWLLLFNLFFILLSLVLRMYVLVAPTL